MEHSSENICERCGKKFTRKSSLVRHQNVVKKCIKIQMFYCDYCGCTKDHLQYESHKLECSNEYKRTKLELLNLQKPFTDKLNELVMRNNELKLCKDELKLCKDELKSSENELKSYKK